MIALKWSETAFKPAYDEIYLDDVMKAHNYLFCVLGKSGYNAFSAIDEYMQHSEIRQQMDKGNWSALNKSAKQMYNSIDFAGCCKNDSDNFQPDEIVLGWIADIYVLFQWRYNISSAVINRRISSKDLCELYNPLHETSLTNAVEKLHYKYFEGLDSYE